METMINAHEFALAVVSSKGFDGTVEEISALSLDLYKAAYDLAVEHNEPIKKRNDKRKQENAQALLNTFGK